MNNYTMPFGKHKGTPLNQLPTDYVDWLKTTDLKDPLRGHFNDFVNSGNTGATAVALTVVIMETEFGAVTV